MKTRKIHGGPRAVRIEEVTNGWVIVLTGDLIDGSGKERTTAEMSHRAVFHSWYDVVAEITHLFGRGEA